IIIRNCYLTNNYFAIQLSDESINSMIINCDIIDNDCGIWIIGSGNCSIIDCVVSNSAFFGIFLDCSYSCFLRENLISNNGYNFAVDGWPEVVYHDIDQTNLVNNKPIYYLYNQHDKLFDETLSIGFLGLIQCSNITISNITIEGILLVESTNISVTNVRSYNSVFGLHCIVAENLAIIDSYFPDNMRGICLVYSQYFLIQNCSGSNNYANDIYTYISPNGIIQSCDIQERGMMLSRSSYVTIQNCSTFEIFISRSTQCLLRNNTMEHFDIYSWYIDDYYQDIDTSNLLRGKPIYLLIEIHDKIFDETNDYAYLGLISCSNITIQNTDLWGVLLVNCSDSRLLNLSSHHAGIGVSIICSSNVLIANSSFYQNINNGILISGMSGMCENNKIVNCQIFNNGASGLYTEGVMYTTVERCDIFQNTYGIYFFSSPNSSITQCSIFNNSGHGTYLYRSHNTEAIDCDFYHNGYDGICLSSVTGCKVINCNFYENYFLGVYFSSYECSDNVVEYCTISNNSGYGVYLFMSGSRNVIRYNEIIDNGIYGCFAEHSNGNIIHHNMFMNNACNAFELYSSNSWDGEEVGNYWDDYTGMDEDGNGIGDIPYDIPQNENQDAYPLMHRYIIGDMNVDGVVTFDDIDPFVLAFSDPIEYQNQYRILARLHGDCNLDGLVDFNDIDPFVSILNVR
ncbi:MAG: hypothetical protein DRI61_16975, partial [Chloroflexi bacterium]